MSPRFLPYRRSLATSAQPRRSIEHRRLLRIDSRQQTPRAIGIQISRTTDDTSQLASFGLGELESLARSHKPFASKRAKQSFRSTETTSKEGNHSVGRFEAIIQDEERTLKFTLEVEKTVVGIAYQSARDSNDPLAETFSKLLEDLSPGGCR